MCIGHGYVLRNPSIVEESGSGQICVSCSGRGCLLYRAGYWAITTNTAANVSSDCCCQISGSLFTMFPKTCCIYTTGVFSILILILGISLVLSNVFPHFLQSVVKKVSKHFIHAFFSIITR